MKEMRTFTVDDEIRLQLFSTETYGLFDLDGHKYGSFLIATTDELTGDLVDYRIDLNYSDTPGIKAMPEILINLLPDFTLNDVTLKEYIQKTPQYGTWEFVVGDEVSAWNASVDHMPQEIAAYFTAAGFEDLDDRDGEDGARYYKYDLENGVKLILTRFMRFSTAGNDMTTVTLEVPTNVYLNQILDMFQLGPET